MRPPLNICVIIPVLDEEARIGALLDELSRHDLHEVIVVDGGSRDATRDIVSRSPGALLVEAARGRAAQMNAGAARATGEILLFLHADVSLPDNAVDEIRATLATPGISAGAFRTWTVADQAGRRKPWWSPLLHFADLRSRYSRLPYGDQALFVLREKFHEMEGFADIPLMEDLELSRRLRRHGAIRVAPASVRVSGRRFLERPVFYTVVVNVFPLLYSCGVPPRWLDRIYAAVR